MHIVFVFHSFFSLLCFSLLSLAHVAHRLQCFQYLVIGRFLQSMHICVMSKPTPTLLTDPHVDSLRFFDYPKVVKRLTPSAFVSADKGHSSSSIFSRFHSSAHRGPAQKRKPRMAGSVHFRLEHFLIPLSSSWLLRNLFCRLYTLCKFQGRTQYALSVSSKRLICNLHVRDEDIADLWLCPT